MNECVRCQGMRLDAYLATSPAAHTQAEHEDVTCQQCCGLSRFDIERVTFHLREASAEALCDELCSRGWVLHRVGVGP
jgi:hypothetical protein